MLDLSPVKLLILLVIAVLLVGPDKLPQAARQMGAAWRKVRDLHTRIDEEVRQNIPDLPSTHDIARLARSPVAFLNQLADIDTSPLKIDGGITGSPGGGSAVGSAGEPGTMPAPNLPPLGTRGVAPKRGGTAGSSPVLGDPTLN